MVTERSQGALPLRAAVAEAASRAALALRGEGGPYVLGELLREGEQVASAAVRVLGPDVLVPYLMEPQLPPLGGEEGQLLRATLTTYRPGADASPVSVWSYRGLAEACQALLPGGTGGGPSAPAGDTGWIVGEDWPLLSHHAARLASLALPGLCPQLADQLAPRTEDLARGFVRAVRRRDWLQAAGIGRWLSRLPAPPATLGLGSGLVFVRHMGAAEPRVDLHLAAAERLAAAEQFAGAG